MRLFLIFGILFLLTSLGQAQQIADTISIEETFKGDIYHHRGEEIKPKDISLLMENYPEAFNLFEDSREAYFFGNFFAVLGTGLIAFPFIMSMSEKDVQWGYAFTGAGFWGLTIPIFRNYNKKSTAAIRLYNQMINMPMPNEKSETSLGLGLSNNGFGVKLTF